MPAESGTKREHVPWLIPPAYSCTVVVVDEKKVVIANGKLSGGIENKQSRMNGRRAPRHAQYHGERHWFLRCSLLHPTSMTMACTNPCSYTYTRILRYMCGGGYCIYVLHSIPYQLLAWKGAMRDIRLASFHESRGRVEWLSVLSVRRALPSQKHV